MEIQALALKYNFNIIVHQVDHPIMAFSNFAMGSVPTLHISYHLGEHYNSVRLIGDNEEGVPAKAIGHELKQIFVEEQEEEKKQSIIVDNGEEEQINTFSSELPTVILEVDL